MVRLYRTFSNLIFTVVTRCVGYLYTVSEWFNPLEPPRTFSNHFSAEKERCVKHISVTKFVNNNKQPQTIKLVNICSYNLLVLGLNRGSPSEEKTSMKKHFVHSLMGHLIEAARLLLDVSCFCADIYYMVPFIMVQHFKTVSSA